MDIQSIFACRYPEGVSDIHLTPGRKPTVRENGALCELDDYPVLTPADTEAAVRWLLNEYQFKRLEENGEIDLSRYFESIDTLARINAYKQRGNYAAAIRINHMRLKTLRELGLPEDVLAAKCALTRGLILVTGPTGVGKSTTIAAMIDWINRHRQCHIVTIEDPIEFFYKHDKCMINQRQIGSDSQTFASALRSVLRQDPDVIVVGEMRDHESIAATLTAAETGHLVISSLHTTGAANTIERIIDVFPPEQQQQVRVQLASVLQCIVSQQLIPRVDGTGRVLAAEVLLSNPSVRNLILQEKTNQLQNVIFTHAKDGMQSLDASLMYLLRRGIISAQSALTYCVDPDYMIREIKLVQPEKPLLIAY